MGAIGMRRLQFVLSSTSLIAVCSSAAWGQAAPVDATPQKVQENQAAQPTVPTNAEGQPVNKKNDETIVVTGSRVRRDNFSTPQNVDILTRQDEVLAGTRTTAETLQNSTITSGTGQVTGAFLGFVAEGGQGANTVGLRGLGSSRTLVLLNGRRLAPAGVGPQLVSADLNVLPTAIVQRIEVLREGASSVYGSDAIAGVINIITDTSINGVTIDGFADHPLIGSGDTLRGSITAGKTFDRGHITASFEYRQTDGLRLNDRGDMDCPLDLFSVNGQGVGQIDPATGNLRCFPFQYDSLGIASGYGIAENFTNGTLNRLTYPGYTTGNPTVGPPVIVNDFNLRPSPPPEQELGHIISPVKTYTAYLNGSYDLGILGDSELYGEALFTRRTSRQDFATQLNFQSGLGPAAQLYGGTYAGLPIDQIGPYPSSPFFPDAFANEGYNYFNPFIVPRQLSFQKQRIDFFRGNAGLRGNLGIGDWRYDGNIQISRTRSVEDVWNPTTSHLTNALDAVVAPAGTPASVITVGLPGQAGAGIGYTCASNLTSGAYNGGSCVPLDFYDPQVLLNGNIPESVYNYIYQNNYDHTAFDQDTAQLVFDGTLFALPGGGAKGAIGFEHRRDHINDTPSIAALDNDLYARSTSGITQGSDIVNEGFAELDLPFFRDRPALNLLEVDASGRYTHYRSYGSDFTFHLTGQWAPVKELRFRANYGTNFRAPNLFEQFVADQTGFYPPSIDPCSDFSHTSDPGSALYNNCLAALTPILGSTNALNYVSTAGPTVTTLGGHGNLKSEHAQTWGFGTVFTMPRRIADFSFAVDYWNITVKNEVTILGNVILNLCYDSTDFPNNRFCDLVGPRAATGASHPGNLTTFNNPYLNVASQKTSGIDFDARYSTPLAGGRLTMQLQATRNLHQKQELFAGEGFTEYNGTPATPTLPGGPKWVGTLDTRFTTPSNITLRWGVKYIGRQDGNSAVDPFTIGGQNVQYDLVAEAYWEHSLSVQWQWPNVGQVTLGMNNVFNEKPPTISGFPTAAGQFFRIGNYFTGADYDLYGRSLFVNVTRSFK